jgi:hypothetical protein
MALSTNWRETGDFYTCQKSGNDLNSGTQALPFETFNKALSSGSNKERVFRAGYYSITSSINFELGNRYIADGYCILDGANIVNTATGSAVNQFEKWTFLNLILTENSSGEMNLLSCIQKGGDLSLFGVVDSSLFLSGITRIKRPITATIVSRCVFNNNLRFYSIGGFNVYNSVFTENCIINNNTNAGFTVPIVWQNCAFSNLTVIDGQQIGLYTLDGEGSDINSKTENAKFSGNLTIGNLEISMVDCFWTSDFGFNDPTIEDYTLKDSPRSILYNQNNIIGAKLVGVRNIPSLTAWDTVNGATYTDINRNTVDDKFELIAPATEGTCQSSLDPAQALSLGGLRTINNPIEVFGELPPLEVIQKTKYNGADPSPVVRRIVEYKIYDESEPNGVDNVLNWMPQDANTWYSMEVGLPLELDGSMQGNGNVDADMTNLGAVVMNRYAQKITLRIDGN